MANLKEVRTRIKSVQSTQQITKAMKMVAASRLRKAQDAILQMRPYAQKLYGILENATKWIESDHQSPYAKDRDMQRVLLVVITSDRGLCGAFNSNIIKLAVKHLKTNYPDQLAAGNLWIMPIGKRGLDHFKKHGYQVIEDHSDLFSDLTFDQVKAAAEFAMKGFLDGSFDRVDLLYNEFKNVATQVLHADQLLPISMKEDEQSSDGAGIDFIFEPSVEFIMKEMIPQTLKIQFYKAVLESNASEQGARMTAMDQATDNASELLGDLRLLYNQTRQAAITTEILEIVGGAEALGKS